MLKSSSWPSVQLDTTPRLMKKSHCHDRSLRPRKCANLEVVMLGSAIRYSCGAILAAGSLWIGLGVAQAQAPVQKPNIILILSDDFGYGDAGAYGGGENRGMPTPSLDRLAAEGMQFMSFYAQPSCTPGRAAVQTGRIPNRSGMTTVAFQGQGGGLPAAEWTLGSVLKTAGYKTFFTGKWHLGEADYALLPPQRLHLRRSDVVPRYGS